MHQFSSQLSGALRQNMLGIFFISANKRGAGKASSIQSPIPQAWEFCIVQMSNHSSGFSLNTMFVGKLLHTLLMLCGFASARRYFPLILWKMGICRSSVHSQTQNLKIWMVWPANIYKQPMDCFTSIHFYKRETEVQKDLDKGIGLKDKNLWWLIRAAKGSSLTKMKTANSG